MRAGNGFVVVVCSPAVRAAGGTGCSAMGDYFGQFSTQGRCGGDSGAPDGADGLPPHIPIEDGNHDGSDEENFDPQANAATRGVQFEEVYTSDTLIASNLIADMGLVGQASVE